MLHFGLYQTQYTDKHALILLQYQIYVPQEHQNKHFPHVQLLSEIKEYKYFFPCSSLVGTFYTKIRNEKKKKLPDVVALLSNLAPSLLYIYIPAV